MLYLLLQRDLQKINLACKHVLSEPELPDALDTLRMISVAAGNRVRDLRGEKVLPPIIPAHSASAVIFEQQGLSPKEQFAIYARGLVGATGSWTSQGRSDRPHTVQHVQ